MKISCIITDDEPIARKGLQGYVDKIDFLQLTAVCEDGVQLNTLLKQQPVDLLFLDIEMPLLSGIDLLLQLPQPPKVILTTAYKQYAVQAHELEVLDYLLKPISFDRFLKAANRAFDYFSSRSATATDYMFIKTDSRLEKVFFAGILFAEALENYVAIYLPDGKLVTHSTLKALAAMLPGNFIQPHKSYIVNINAITTIEGNVLHVGGYQVPVSKYQKAEVMEKILNNRLLNK